MRKGGRAILATLVRTRQTDEKGRLLAATVAGRSDYARAIKESGISERTAQYWQRAAAMKPPLVEKYLADNGDDVAPSDGTPTDY